MEFVRHEHYDEREIMYRIHKNFRTKLNRKTINKLAMFDAFRKFGNMYERLHRVRYNNSSTEQQQPMHHNWTKQKTYRQGNVILFGKVSKIVYSLRFFLAFHIMGPSEILVD